MIADRIVYKVAFSNLLCSGALSDSLTFFDTLSGAHSFRDSIAHLFRNLSTLPDILNFELVIIPDVTLLLMGDLLQGLLHAIALLLGVIRALVNQHNLTQVAVHNLQLVLLCCATVLFLGIRALLLVSSLILSHLWWYTFRYSLCYTAVHIESGTKFHTQFGTFAWEHFVTFLLE